MKEKLSMPKQRSPETTPRPSLLVSKEEAPNKITRQIEQGRQLDNVDIRDDDSLQNVRASKTRWVSYTVELLSRIFDHESIANDFEHTYGTVNYRASFPQLVRSLKEEIAKKVTKLESVVERLELIPEVNVKPRISPESVASTTSKEIFIVHGRDEAAKESVSRFIERLGLRAIILHEQSNVGRTIIEKFEHHSNVGFAVVLLTPDDIGAPKDWPEDAKPRARLNVIFEWYCQVNRRRCD